LGKGINNLSINQFGDWKISRQTNQITSVCLTTNY